MRSDDLGNRMKIYEAAFKAFLPERLPVIVRVDGKAFHTLTRHLDKPRDLHFEYAMTSAALAMCQHMQGAQCAYCQSDEISVLLYPWQNNESMAWYGNNLQKISSVAASIAAVTFSRALNAALDVMVDGFFDGRSFVLPECEVENYFIWRQNDAIRNAVQGLGQANFSHKQLQGASCHAIVTMLNEAGIKADDVLNEYQHGRLLVRKDEKWTVQKAADFKTVDARNEFRNMMKQEAWYA